MKFFDKNPKIMNMYHKNFEAQIHILTTRTKHTKFY